MSEQENTITQTAYDWEGMLVKSDYSTIKFIRELMHQGKYAEAKEGMDRLYEFETKVEKRAIKKALRRLMELIVLWNVSADYRNGEHASKIMEARDNVKYHIEEDTELNSGYLKSVWDEIYQEAIEFVEIELGYKPEHPIPEWYDVFEREFTIFEKNQENE